MVNPPNTAGVVLYGLLRHGNTTTRKKNHPKGSKGVIDRRTEHAHLLYPLLILAGRAADGNRTRVSGLGSVRSTIELQPRIRNGHI